MTSPSAAEVRGSVPVVKLEWRKAIEGTLSSAETLIDTYRVWTHSEADGRWFWCLDGWESGDAQDEAGAKGAAQADYEQRTLSALNPDFLSALDTARAEIERLRTALNPFSAIGQYLIDQGFTTKPDNGDMWGFDGISVTYGDFRTAARATLSPAVKEPK